MKFFHAVAGVVAITAYAPAAHAQTAQPACEQLDFTQKATDFGSLNGVIDLAVSANLIPIFIKPYDPYALTNETLDMIPVSLLGHDFEITPTIKNASLVGISTLVPRHFNVTGPTNLNFGVDFSGTVALEGTFSLNIKQDKKWWQLCYTDLISVGDCKPKTTEIEVALSVTKPKAGLDFSYAMMHCPASAPAGTCKELLVSDLLTAALSQKFDAIAKRILLRSKSLDISNIELDYETINEIHFHFDKSGSLLTALGEKLLNFTEKELNKKGPVAKIAVEVTEKLVKSLVNNLVKALLAPQFGAGCYDPKA
ncbi:hypothetical protein Poli38472_014161 [Pythium oligandrum]|uniref:Uncharacterized protein n=1 Tax=Pythium oligandrum TaxID=41045 RepID=A0A8K1CI78_PYTOL|nr:hypothetical protein Poli38472_014161 [Pythium oligandrum]|eukprot:TMW64044.1 hypothetical protein Poli38472_014161 [Pythium oligandrum]